jgi:hypothetical protein
VKQRVGRIIAGFICPEWGLCHGNRSSVVRDFSSRNTRRSVGHSTVPHASGSPMDKESGPHRGRLGYASRLCQEQSGSRHARLAGNYHMPQKSRFEKDAITAHAQPHRRHQAMDVLLRISDRRGTAANWQVVFIRTISCGGVSSVTGRFIGSCLTREETPVTQAQHMSYRQTGGIF